MTGRFRYPGVASQLGSPVAKLSASSGPTASISALIQSAFHQLDLTGFAHVIQRGALQFEISGLGTPKLNVCTSGLERQNRQLKTNGWNGWHSLVSRSEGL